MADAIVSLVLEQLATFTKLEVSMVVGVQKEVKKLTGTLQAISAVLVDAEKRQLKEEVVKLWVERLKGISYDADDVLDEWRTRVIKRQIEGPTMMIRKKKVCFYLPISSGTCFGLRHRHHIAAKIKDINEKLDEISAEKDKFRFESTSTTSGSANEEVIERRKTTSFVDLSGVYGRKVEKEDVVSKLRDQGIHSTAEGVIALVGMGGIGKTTLAQQAYHEVMDAFDKSAWVCVSDPFDGIRIAKAIIGSLEGNTPNIVDLDPLCRRIEEFIKGKKFLLVLDDVWNEDYSKWEPLKTSLESALVCRVLVTTRSERVANIMGASHPLRLGLLPDEQCWLLFIRIAFSGRSEASCQELEKHFKKKILDKCKGLPLAAKTLGGLLRFKKGVQDWENVLDSYMWELEVAQRDLFAHLFLSYYDLPTAVKKCFSYCGIFRKDEVIEADKLIQLWMAQGYLSTRRGNLEMEIIGREYLEDLAMRSLFQDLGISVDGIIVSCKMHDIVHDFVQLLTKNECFFMPEGNDCETQEKLREWQSNTKTWRHLTLECHSIDIGRVVLVSNTEKLRTLSYIKGGTGPSTFTDFPSLTCLRALDLSFSDLLEIPMEVGTLIHLRFLDVSNNDYLQLLPETICDLCNLQTLRIDHCPIFRALPRGMDKLINLRHLGIYETQVSRLPKGIGRLSSIRTLSNFPVASGSSSDDCEISDLKELNNIGGSLEIEGLNKEIDASDAEKAELKNKKNLLGLVLSYNLEEEKGDGGRMDATLEALQPHPNLQHLRISWYPGIKFPSWLISLSNLRTLDLSFCMFCRCLPPLGKLSSLENLWIERLDSLECVGLEFWGITDDGHGTSHTEMRTSSSSSSVIIFPKLKKLGFSTMMEWQEWDDIVEEDIQIMPCLESLALFNCRKLKALPRHLLLKLKTSSTAELYIEHCSKLEQPF